MKQLLLILSLVTSGFVYGQEIKSDFIDEITKQDISDLWTLKKFRTEFEGDTSWVERMDPLGYIGSNYQRFYIHFSSVIKNTNNKLEYIVYGKTKVNSNICSFHGLIKIKSTKIGFDNELPSTKQGFLTGDYEFYEDSIQSDAGILKGRFRTDFYIDNKGLIKYNALRFIADGFKNNQFEGIWISYKSNDSKKCNWGDYRIPDSKDLDIGAGEFGVSEKYVSNGWVTYVLDHKMNKLDVVENSKISQAEKEKWWLEK